MGDSGGASGGDDAPLGAAQFGQALADAVHQLVHVDERAGSLIHGPLHLGQGGRAGDDGVSAAGVDERADADGAVHIGADFEGSRHGAADTTANGLRQGQYPSLPEQVAPLEAE